MADVSLLETMRDRVPYWTARRLLVEFDYPRAQGWDSVIDKVKGLASKAKLNAAGLEAAYRETIISSEKLVRLYPVNGAALAGIHSAMAKLVLNKTHAGVKKFPRLMNETERANYAVSQPEPVALESLSDGVALIFASVRSVTIKEPIAPSQLPAGISTKYREVFGQRHITTQYFDVVLVPHQGEHIFVLTDNPIGLHALDKLHAQAAARKAFNAALKLNTLQSPVNLFPAIKYLAAKVPSQAGRIVDLDTMSATALESRQRIHNDACVTKDPAYQALIAAKVKFAPFGVAAEWDFPSSNGYSVTPHLSLGGSVRLATVAKPEIEDATIKCGHYSELRHALTKLEEAL